RRRASAARRRTRRVAATAPAGHGGRAFARVASRARRRARGSRARVGRSSSRSSGHGFWWDRLGYPFSGLITYRGTKPRRGIAGAASALLVLALAGCGGSQNALNPHSHAATDIANLFWVMMAVSFGGLALITGLLVFAWVRRGRRGIGGDAADPHPGEKPAWFVVLGMGVVFPLMVIVAPFIVGNWAIIKTTQAPATSSTDLTVDAIGHQWYWEFRYPGTKAVTADEMHIPVGTRVNLVATTADVIHSFWVPELNRKIDTIPGQQNRILLYSNKVGVFRGQCAEYCGLQHAHMG